jgi:hypothetical protein
MENFSTPITDAATFEILSALQSGKEKVVYQSIARDLERSLAERTEERNGLRIAFADASHSDCSIGAERFLKDGWLPPGLKDELYQLRLRVSTVETANADLAAERDAMTAERDALSKTLETCQSVLTEIRIDDDNDVYPLDHRVRTRLDKALLNIKELL